MPRIIKILRPRSLRGKMLIFGCGIAFFTALFISILSYYRTSQIAFDSAIEELAGEARLTALRVEAAYVQMRNDVAVISGTPSIAGVMRSMRSGGNDPVDGSTIALWRTRLATNFTALIRSRSQYTQIQYIGVADNGRELVRVSRVGPDINAVSPEELRQKTDEDYFQEALKLKPGEIYFSEISLNRERGQLGLTATPTLRAIAPIYDENGNYFGMVIINADYHIFMSNVLKQFNSGREVFLVNNSEYYVSEDGNGNISLMNINGGDGALHPEFIEKIQKSKADQFYLTGGESITYVIRTAINSLQPDYFFSTALQASKNQLLADAHDMINETVVLGLVLIVTASIIAAMLSNRFTRPIYEMTEQVAAFNLEGKTTFNLPVNARDEVGKLARAFQEMAGRLQQSHATQTKLSIQLNAFLKNAVDGFITIDESGIIEQVNPAALQMLGYEEHELIGENISILMQEPVHSQHTEYLRRYRETGKQTVIGKIREERAVRKDGTVIPVAISTSEIKLDGRRIFTGVLRDISERKRKEADLRASEETFRLAMHNAPIGMALAGLDGKFLKVNKALCTLLGYGAEELTERNFQELTHPEDLEADLENVHNILTGQSSSYAMEKRYITKSGGVVWTQLNVSVVRSDDGTPRYYIKQIQDITARKETDQLKDEFVSVVSHELRTPLTSIRGALGLIIGAMSKDLPERVTDLLMIAHKSSERLIVLINDILDMEKITSGRMQFSLEEQDLKKIAENAISLNKAYADQYGVTFLADFPNADFLVRADEARLMQVISNLLSNAAKFAPIGSTVEVRLERSGMTAKLSVQDYGQGIPEKFRSQIFERFSQADSSTTREKGGSGLGLHISREMIEKMGGEIGFESIEGEGATFWFALPLKSQTLALAGQPLARPVKENHLPAQIDEKRRVDSPATRKMLMLDELEVLEVTAEHLQKAGFDTTIVSSKEQASEILRREKIDVLVMTLVPESRDSADILESLRSTPDALNVPILIVSGGRSFAARESEASLLGDVQKIMQMAHQDDRSRGSFQTAALPVILHVEDDIDFSRMLASALRDKAVLLNAPTLSDARARLRSREFALIVLDIALPDGNGLDLVAGGEIPCTPVFVLSANELPASVANISTALVKSRQSESQLVEMILAMIAKHAQADEEHSDDRKTQSNSVH